MTSSIGIKIANGEFYPVLEEGSTVKKRLVLTTVHDGQRSVQIDLYRSESRSMADASYIGSLVVENIADKAKGEPSIELVIGSEDADELSAEAADLDDASAGSRQTLSVSLKAMNDEDTYDVPDFELESEAPSAPPAGLYEKPEDEDADEDEDSERRAGFPVVPVVAAVLAALLIAGALSWFFLFNKGAPAPKTESPAPKLEQPASAPVPAETAKAEPAPASPPPGTAQAAVPPPAETPAASPAQRAPAAVPPAAARIEPQKPAAAAVPAKPAKQTAAAVPAKPAVPAVSKSEAAARRARPSAPVKTYKVPKKIPKEGFRYRIRWGDTLWDISEAFYRNPWQYPRIARFNKIRNPDFILAGAYIRVPPKK